MTPLDDVGLAQGLAADLDPGFEALVHAYQDRLYAFALRMTTSHRDAEEIAQDALIRAYRALVRYSPERIAELKVRPWLFQIAINVVRNRVRVQRLAEVPLTPPDDPTGRRSQYPDDAAELPEAVAERRDGEARLAAVVGSLPERYRAAVVLRHVQGLSYQEVAEMLRQPAGTVKSNVHRGVALLRAALSEAGDLDGPPEPACELAAGRAS